MMSRKMFTVVLDHCRSFNNNIPQWADINRSAKYAKKYCFLAFIICNQVTLMLNFIV